MTIPQFPQVIVEMGFNAGASTGTEWHIGDSSRGRIGTFTIGPQHDGPFTDVTSYVMGLQLTSGASSRITFPLVTYEAGSAHVALDNETRAFDPLNTSSPFYSAGTTTVTPVPGTLSNAQVADVLVTANDAGVTIAGGSSAQAAAGFGAVTVTANDATVTGTTGGNKPTGQLYGASHGAVWSDTKTLLNPQAVRNYESLPASYGATSQMSDIPAALSQVASFKPDLTVLGDTSAPGYGSIANKTGIIWTLYHVLSGLSDQAHVQHWVIIHHEPVGSGKYADTGYINTDGTYTLTDWQNAQKNFRHDVLDPLNNTRTHPIMFTTGHNGFIFTHGKDGQGNWVYDPAPMNTWFNSSVRAVFDAYGLDCYGYNQSPPHDQFGWGAQWASDHGMRYCVGELGYAVGGAPGGGGDTNELTVAQRVMGQVKNMAVADRPLFVTWFNGNSSTLLSTWQSQVYWKDVCTNTSVQPT